MTSRSEEQDQVEMEWHDAGSKVVDLERIEAVRLPIKPEMIGGLVRYKENRIPTGSFLRAILENDLKEAVSRGDHYNIWSIPALVSWCYNNLPSGSWGSPARVSAWLTREEPK